MIQTVEVPEWGGAVGVKAMSGLERDAFYATVGEKPSNARFSAALLVATVVDDTGAPIFAADDLDALMKKSAIVVARLVDVSLALNAIGPKAVEDAAKNSGAALSGASGSGSPLTSENQ
ncbi:hypothetical protein [Paraburkholderia tuberum]|uniref:hypothetical protein n=1 Tax=Paraburkholderia tuberum TaxID=157910 RepID=UPI00115F95D6|nr:hypothetical protein [Paraburkholderia tuberum]